MTTGAVSSLSRRERKKRELRGRIVEAALALFDLRGFEATTVAEICAGADVAHKTFFNYFPSKQDLMREVAQQSLDQLLREIRKACERPGGTPGRLHHLFGRIAEDAERAGPMHREFLTEMIHVAHESGTESEQARELHAAFAALVRAGRSAGDVTSAHSVQTLTELVVGSFYALMFNWANLEGYPLRRQSLAAARLLGEALAVRPGEAKR